IIRDPFNITVNNFETKTLNGQNFAEIKKELETHLNSQFNEEDKDLIIILLLVNIIGIICIFITLNSKLLSSILIIILVLGNIILFYKLNKRSKLRNIAKQKMYNETINNLERVLAEATDYNEILKTDDEDYQ